MRGVLRRFFLRPRPRRQSIHDTGGIGHEQPPSPPRSPSHAASAPASAAVSTVTTPYGDTRGHAGGRGPGGGVGALLSGRFSLSLGGGRGGGGGGMNELNEKQEQGEQHPQSVRTLGSILPESAGRQHVPFQWPSAASLFLSTEGVGGGAEGGGVFGSYGGKEELSLPPYLLPPPLPPLAATAHHPSSTSASASVSISGPPSPLTHSRFSSAVSGDDAPSSPDAASTAVTPPRHGSFRRLPHQPYSGSAAAAFPPPLPTLVPSQSAPPGSFSRANATPPRAVARASELWEAEGGEEEAEEGLSVAMGGADDDDGLMTLGSEDGAAAAAGVSCASERCGRERRQLLRALGEMRAKVEGAEAALRQQRAEVLDLRQQVAMLLAVGFRPPRRPVGSAGGGGSNYVGGYDSVMLAPHPPPLGKGPSGVWVARPGNGSCGGGGDLSSPQTSQLQPLQGGVGSGGAEGAASSSVSGGVSASVAAGYDGSRIRPAARARINPALIIQVGGLVDYVFVCVCIHTHTIDRRRPLQQHNNTQNHRRRTS